MSITQTDEQIGAKAELTARFIYQYFNYQIPENELLPLCIDLEKRFQKNCLYYIRNGFHASSYEQRLKKGWLADNSYRLVERKDFAIYLKYENEKLKIECTWKDECLSKDESIANYKKWKHCHTDLFPYSIDFSDAIYMEYWDFSFLLRYGRQP